MKKKYFQRLIVLGGLTLGMLATTTSCSSDDDAGNGWEVVNGDISVAVGTYKGTLYYRSYSHIPDIDQYEFYDAILLVTRNGENRIEVKAKSGETYSIITPKTLQVESYSYNGKTHVDSVIGEVNGSFSYYPDSQSIYVSTERTGETELNFTFEGVKQ